MDRLNQEFSIEVEDILVEGDEKGGDEEDDEGGNAVPAYA